MRKVAEKQENSTVLSILTYVYMMGLLMYPRSYKNLVLEVEQKIDDNSNEDGILNVINVI